MRNPLARRILKEGVFLGLYGGNNPLPKTNPSYRLVITCYNWLDQVSTVKVNLFGGSRIVHEIRASKNMQFIHIHE